MLGYFNKHIKPASEELQAILDSQWADCSIQLSELCTACEKADHPQDMIFDADGYPYCHNCVPNEKDLYVKSRTHHTTHRSDQAKPASTE